MLTCPSREGEARAGDAERHDGETSEQAPECRRPQERVGLVLARQRSPDAAVRQNHEEGHGRLGKSIDAVVDRAQKVRHDGQQGELEEGFDAVGKPGRCGVHSELTPSISAGPYGRRRHGRNPDRIRVVRTVASP